MAQVRTEADLLSDCVHCGFCLPACPTYVSWGLEMDSPRGRIDLMNGLQDGAIELTGAVVTHFDRCLGCMACVTACPSGVRYDLLIESTRAQIEKAHSRTPYERAFRTLIFEIFPYPGRLRALAYPLAFAAQSGLRSLVRRSGLLKLLPPGFAQLEALAPQLSAPEIAQSILPPVSAAKGRQRGRVALVAGCVQRVFFPNVNLATLRVLSAEGFEVVVPEAQGCCGALSLHAGRDGEARAFARALVERFEGEDVDAVIVNAAGCGSTLKQYGELFADDPVWRERGSAFAGKVKDINEFLAGIEPVAPRNPLPIRAAYHDACHLAHAQRIRNEPRKLLRTIPELELVEIPEGDQCCGSAGVYNLLEPGSATEIGARKVDNVLSTEADVVISANPGCTLQIRTILDARGQTLLMAHPIEVLDAALD